VPLCFVPKFVFNDTNASERYLRSFDEMQSVQSVKMQILVQYSKVRTEILMCSYDTDITGQ
jgi:hypothetical protein